MPNIKIITKLQLNNIKCQIIDTLLHGKNTKFKHKEQRIVQYKLIIRKKQALDNITFPK